MLRQNEGGGEREIREGDGCGKDRRHPQRQHEADAEDGHTKPDAHGYEDAEIMARDMERGVALTGPRHHSSPRPSHTHLNAAARSLAASAAQQCVAGAPTKSRPTRKEGHRLQKELRNVPGSKD